MIDFSFFIYYNYDNNFKHNIDNIMKLSTKGRYAVRAMLDLALQNGDTPTLVKDISKRQGISDLYLEQLLTRLQASGLIRSIRGPKGGFLLTRAPSKIRLCDILQTVEGSMAPVECVENGTLCDRADICITRKVWIKMKHAVDEVLESTTLQDLVEWNNNGNNDGNKVKTNNYTNRSNRRKLK
jgi:Rrf2 family cysteine metabolism transcriptional repressor